MTCHGLGEVVLLLGRRASKNFMVSIVIAWLLFRLLAMEDPQSYYQMPPEKTLQIPIFGTDQVAVRRDAFGDVARVLRSAACFEPFLGSQTSTSITLLTPAQLKAGERSGVDEGSIVVAAAATTATAGRGPSMPSVWFDEIGFLLGAGSTATSVGRLSQRPPSSRTR